jgi:phytoene synthase
MPQPQSEPGFSTASDLAACRAAIRSGSKTFHAASLILPAAVRDPALALYAFCRLADDAIDESGAPEQALVALHQRLGLAYAGRPIDVAADRALADVVFRFSIPREIPEALLEGFAWDAGRRRYEGLPDLLAYATRVAGTVGVMMALLMGARSAQALARAADLGAAMQLSNIARDVGEDARAGRLYLPLAWLRAAGVDPEVFLANPSFGPGIAAVVESLLESAASLYRRAAHGVAELPPRCRPAIHAARLMYAEIGQEVARAGCDSVTRRAVVAPSRKAVLLARALSAGARRGTPSVAPAIPEAQFLIDAVLEFDARHGIGGQAFSGRRRTIQQQLIATLELFERLEQRARVSQAG